MCSQCDDENNIDPVLTAEGTLIRAKRVDEYVREGIAFLDKLVEEGVIEPGWADRINLNVLNMGSLSDCVLGQLFAPMARAKYEMEVQDGTYDAYLPFGYDYAKRIIEELDESDIDLGFNSVDCEWYELKAAWTFHIKNMQTV